MLTSCLITLSASCDALSDSSGPLGDLKAYSGVCRADTNMEGKHGKGPKLENEGEIPYTSPNRRISSRFVHRFVVRKGKPIYIGCLWANKENPCGGYILGSPDKRHRIDGVVLEDGSSFSIKCGANGPVNSANDCCAFLDSAPIGELIVAFSDEPNFSGTPDNPVVMAFRSKGIPIGRLIQNEINQGKTAQIRLDPSQITGRYMYVLVNDSRYAYWDNSGYFTMKFGQPDR